MPRQQQSGSGEYESGVAPDSDDRLILVRRQPRRWCVATVACVLAMSGSRCETLEEWADLLDEIDVYVRPLSVRL